ncbi:MAG: hypothetical protein ACQEW8_04470 [Actinomycetota bacterium]
MNSNPEDVLAAHGRPAYWLRLSESRDSGVHRVDLGSLTGPVIVDLAQLVADGWDVFTAHGSRRTVRVFLTPPEEQSEIVMPAQPARQPSEKLACSTAPIRERPAEGGPS